MGFFAYPTSPFEPDMGAVIPNWHMPFRPSDPLVVHQILHDIEIPRLGVSRVFVDKMPPVGELESIELHTKLNVLHRKFPFAVKLP